MRDAFELNIRTYVSLEAGQNDMSSGFGNICTIINSKRCLYYGIGTTCVLPFQVIRRLEHMLPIAFLFRPTCHVNDQL